MLSFQVTWSDICRVFGCVESSYSSGHLITDLRPHWSAPFKFFLYSLTNGNIFACMPPPHVWACCRCLPVEKHFVWTGCFISPTPHSYCIASRTTFFFFYFLECSHGSLSLSKHPSPRIAATSPPAGEASAGSGSHYHSGSCSDTSQEQTCWHFLPSGRCSGRIRLANMSLTCEVQDSPARLQLHLEGQTELILWENWTGKFPKPNSNANIKSNTIIDT